MICQSAASHFCFVSQDSCRGNRFLHTNLSTAEQGISSQFVSLLWRCFGFVVHLIIIIITIGIGTIIGSDIDALHRIKSTTRSLSFDFVL